MGKILYTEQSGTFVLKLVGDVRVTLGPTLCTFLDSLVQKDSLNSMVIDLREATGIDSTSLGLLAKISMCCKSSFDTVPTVVSTNEDITRLLISMGFDQLFVVVQEFDESCSSLGELPTEIVSEAKLREQVLDAHKVLMDMNERNRKDFKDLVEALEKESKPAPTDQPKAAYR